MRAAARVVAQLVRADGEYSGVDGAAEHADARTRLDELREQREHVEG